MSFTGTPLDGSSSPIPMASVVPDGTNTPVALEGGPSLSSGGNTLAPVSMYVKDGNDVTQGAASDTAATSDTGTFSLVAFIKRLQSKFPGQGQAAMSASIPVVVASNQSAIPVSNASQDTFGTATPLTAATTFTGVPTISQLQASSSVLLANPGNQATFTAEIAIASAFVGTLSFYGLEPDGATLQLINAHQRSTTTIATSTAINTGVALNQVWMGSIANFKSVYVVCTAFTSGSASVQLGLTAAPYGMAILNTVNVLDTNSAASKADLDTIAANTGTSATQNTSTATNTTNIGASGDAAVVGDTAGSLSAKLRGLTKMINDMWDSTNHWLQVKVMNGNANGQNTAFNSAPVVLASDQSPNVLAATSASNALSSQMAWLLAGADKEVSFTTTTVQAVASTDVTNYRWVSVHITGQGTSSTITFQGSNDNTNWVSITLYNTSSPTNVGVASTTSTGTVYHGPLPTRYFRLNVTGISAGTTAGVIEFHTLANVLHGLTTLAQQQGTWTQVPNAATTGGSTPFHLVSAASTNATTVKASAGQVYSYNIANTNAAIRYVHLYNKASNPTVGTDVPVKTFLVPATGQISGSFSVGSAFGTGIALSTTVSSADTASDAVGAGDLIIDLETK